jgi:hypothetical protein
MSPSSTLPSTTLHTVLDPAACAAIEPAIVASGNPDVRVHRYTRPDTGWQMSIATHGARGSDTLSLGGFRIAPEHRTSLASYDNDREAIELAVGMEEKIYWSRVIGVGGPLLRRRGATLVGGKCVLRPSSDARIGQPRDAELLDFAIECFRHMESESGVHLVTGQDLGHGTMSDGTTTSLAYMHERFHGSVRADTSKPTAEGNYRLLRGMLAALDVPLRSARVALVGCGNIGLHVLQRLGEEGAEVTVVEASETRRAEIAGRAARVLAPAAKREVLAMPLDAIVVNASGGSLDDASVAAIAANETVKVICGSENLAMPDPRGAAALLAARKLYAPTELGGMMGYLTAVEEYLARRAGTTFELSALLDAARRLDTVGYEAARQVVSGGYRQTFEDAVREIFSAPAGAA